MATLIKNPVGIYQIVFYECGRRIWRSSLMFRTVLVFSFSVPNFGLSQMDSTLPQRENTKPSPEARQETIYRVLNKLGIELNYVEQRAFNLHVSGEHNQAKSVCDRLWNKLGTLKTSITKDSTLTKDDIKGLRDSESSLLDHEIELPMPINGNHNPE